MTHFIERCRTCGTIVSQCRCPNDGDKVERSIERCVNCIREQKRKADQDAMNFALIAAL